MDVITLAWWPTLNGHSRSTGMGSAGVWGWSRTEYPDDETHAAGAIVLFRLANGMILTLYPRSELAKDAAVSPGPARSGEFSLGHLVASRAAVDALLSRAEAAGAAVTAPHDRPPGIYSGYFRDLDVTCGRSSTPTGASAGE